MGSVCCAFSTVLSSHKRLPPHRTIFLRCGQPHVPPCLLAWPRRGGLIDQYSTTKCPMDVSRPLEIIQSPGSPIYTPVRRAALGAAGNQRAEYVRELATACETRARSLGLDVLARNLGSWPGVWVYLRTRRPKPRSGSCPQRSSGACSSATRGAATSVSGWRKTARRSATVKVDSPSPTSRRRASISRGSVSRLVSARITSRILWRV